MRAVRGGRGAAGPRAASRLTVDHAHGGGNGGSGWPGQPIRSRPRWRRRGAYVAATRAGWRKTKAPAANGRRAAAVSPGRRATTRGDGAYTGMTRENERERANGLDSPEGVRRRRIAAAATGGEERGKRRRGLEGPIPGGESIYAATGTHRLRRIRRKRIEGGRRRETLPSSGGDGGEHTASDDSTKGKRCCEEGERRDALPCGTGCSDEGPTARECSLRPRAGEEEEDELLESPSASTNVPAPPAREARKAAANRAREAATMEWRRWDKREEKGGRVPGLIGRQCRFGNRPWAVKARAGARRSRPKRRQRWMTPAGKRKGKKGGGKGGLPPCHFGEKEEGERATRRRGEALPPSLGGTRGERRGRVDDDGDDGGAVWNGAATRAADAGQAQQALTAAATGRSATTACARAGGAAIWVASAGSGGEGGGRSARRGSRARVCSARAEWGRGRERERDGEGGRDGPRGIRPIEPEGGKIDFCGGI
uniref:Uncharacterized protein n=1 Tax=Oryza sativa subsp. japonica TaxID=39947 RepID=Q75KL2_ORYSJ|nr:hypothetical protein [Oryza sativa Japonica Group]